MLTVIVETLLFQVRGQLICDNRFQYLTRNWRQWNWSVVALVTSVSLFEDWTHCCKLPILWYRTFLQGFVKYYGQWFRNCVWQIDSGFATVSVQLFRTAGWMLSGPCALSSFSANNLLLTFSSVMMITGQSVFCSCTWLPFVSGCSGASWTKTLLKQLAKVCAASSSVSVNLPFTVVSLATLSFTVFNFCIYP